MNSVQVIGRLTRDPRPDFRRSRAHEWRKKGHVSRDFAVGGG